MYQKILVATDGSEHSRRAFKQAIDMAKALGSKIILLHVVFTPEALGYVLTGSAAVIQEQIGLNGEAILDITVRGIDAGGIVVEKKAVPGHPVAKILEEIATNCIDLVIMGSRGYGPVAGSLMGSISQRVLHYAACPVMIVK